MSMKRSLFNGSFLIVEGVTDSRLYGKFTDKDECDIIVAHSKDNVRISVRESYLRRNDKKVIGIIDHDLDKMKGIVHSAPIFATDSRDIDTEMIRSSALDNVLVEYGDKDLVDRFVRRYGEVRDILVRSCYPLGMLMYVSDVHDHALSFKDPDHTEFIDTKSLSVDVKKMISYVISRSPHSNVSEEELTKQFNRELKEERDPWAVCRGHDMISLLTICLREIFGGYNAKYIKTGETAGALRLAYTDTEFRRTSLFRSTAEWSAANKFAVWTK